MNRVGAVQLKAEHLSILCRFCVGHWEATIDQPEGSQRTQGCMMGRLALVWVSQGLTS